MKVNDFLIKKIEERIQDKNQLISLISLTLKKSPSSIYRRIKGEIPFTFEEAIVLAKHFGISFDNLTENHTTYSIIQPQVNIIDKDKIEMSFPIADNYCDIIFKLYEIESDTEHGALSPTVPYTFFSFLPSWVYFYNFYWAYRNGYTYYSLEEFNEKYNGEIDKEEFNRKVKLIVKSKYTYVFTSRDMLKTLISDFNYFNHLGKINEELRQTMKNELISFIDLFEEMAVSGKIYSTGNVFELYISDTIFNEGLEYLCNENTCIASQSMFAIEANIYDMDKSKKIKKWVDSMKRLSTKISNSSYLERTEFFDLQRKYIDQI